MAWYLTYFDRSRHIVPISNIPQVCDQDARNKAVEIARGIWLSVQACGQDIVSHPEIVWKEPLEDADAGHMEMVGVGSKAGIHQPDETAEYDFFTEPEYQK